MQVNFSVDREKNNKLETATYKYAYCLPEFHSQIKIFGVTEGKMEMLVDGKRKIFEKTSSLLCYPIHCMNLNGVVLHPRFI